MRGCGFLLLLGKMLIAFQGVVSKTPTQNHIKPNVVSVVIPLKQMKNQTKCVVFC